MDFRSTGSLCIQRDGKMLNKPDCECLNFSSEPVLGARLHNHRLIPINRPESANLCHVWPVCSLWGMAVFYAFWSRSEDLGAGYVRPALMSAVIVLSSGIAWVDMFYVSKPTHPTRSPRPVDRMTWTEASTTTNGKRGPPCPSDCHQPYGRRRET